jgi:serine/threonine-protein kinase HipA
MPKTTPATRFDTLWLWYLGQPTSPQLVGELRLLNIGRGVSLTYAASWREAGFRLSEDLPLADMEYLPRAQGRAAGAVDDARPDRWGERVIQFLDKPGRLSLMEYLYYAGDDRFGALGVSSSKDEYLPRRSGPLPRLANAQTLSEVMRKISAREPLNDIERQMAGAGGSLGGAKPKALITIDEAEWVLKFFSGEPVDAPLIEHASMTLAAKAGIRVAETMTVRLKGETALAVRRFDRVLHGRIHCISAGTALRAVTAAEQPPDLGYPALAQLLRRAGDATDGANQHEMREIFRRMIFNILIDNTDDHEKNHALMWVPGNRAGRLRLTPAYDVLPTNSGQGHQEFVVGTEGRDSTLANAMSQSTLFGLNAAAAAQEVLGVIAVVDTWQEHFTACGVTQADIQNLAERIDGAELLGQRRGFSPGEYDTPAPKRRRHPFS